MSTTVRILLIVNLKKKFFQFSVNVHSCTKQREPELYSVFAHENMRLVFLIRLRRFRADIAVMWPTEVVL